MIIWGGWGGVNQRDPRFDGGRYDPRTDSWLPITDEGARRNCCGVAIAWTGDELIVVGETEGGRYDPQTDHWTPISMGGAPRFQWSGVFDHEVGVWIGDELVVAGNDGQVLDRKGLLARYRPATDEWTALPSSYGIAPVNAAMGWTGTELILGSGRWNPLTDTWAPVATTGRVVEAYSYVSAWTGGQLIVWGGYQPLGREPARGAVYDFESDAWEPISEDRAPDPRSGMSAAWAGDEFWIWGGSATMCDDPCGAGRESYIRYSNSGAAYNPATESWRRFSVPLSERSGASTVWTGDSVIIFGGGSGIDPRRSYGIDRAFGDGARFSSCSPSY